MDNAIISKIRFTVLPTNNKKIFLKNLGSAKRFERIKQRCLQTKKNIFFFFK